MRIILASKSMFRKKALDILGLEYEVIPSSFDEKSIRDKDPERLAKKLAEAKAKDVGEKHKDAIVISGDLFVVFNNKIYEKPKNKEEAFEMLKSFSGKELNSVSSVAVYNSKTKKLVSSADRSKAKFRKLLDYEIKDYISKYPVLKFSAAFDSNGLLRFAERVEGKLSFITGFSMNELILLLREQGVKV